MEQVIRIQGKNIPFSRVSIARAGKLSEHKLTVQVPVNVSIAGNIKVQTAMTDPGISAPFARCQPAGCFAEFELTDESLRKFRATNGTGKVTFKNAAGRDIVIPLSFKGFAQAFGALAKE